MSKQNLDYFQHFESLIKNQLERIERLKQSQDFVDYGKSKKIVIGFCGGDGIGPIIVDAAKQVLQNLLKNELESGKVEFKPIEGLTIENRILVKKTVPDEVLTEIKKCDVFLKGPTTTPKTGDGLPELESANVFLRRELDLFANVRPIKVVSKSIDWVFFRENTEGSYALGSNGLEIGPDLAIDFTVTTRPASKRIAKLAFEFAKKTGRKKVTVVTKANIVKKTDGSFLSCCREIAKNYPEIELTDLFIDIATAKLIDEHEQANFSVFVLPNLYGDIITDEAAQIQGGVGTAGSANLGTRFAMFEAVHGSAPQMFKEHRQQFADPSSILRAAVMMLNHVGFNEKALKLEKALDYCSLEDSKCKVTGYDDGATTFEFTSNLLKMI